MTAQIADKLVNNFNGIGFGGLRLYSVLRGEPLDISSMEKYSFKNSPNKNKLEVSSACWDGYACSYELSEKGGLSLVGFWYPLSFDTKPDKVLEVLEGDFWLCLRKEFFEQSVFVPFRDGKIVVDRGEWFTL